MSFSESWRRGYFWLGFIYGQFLTRAIDPLMHGTATMSGEISNASIALIFLGIWAIIFVRKQPV